MTDPLIHIPFTGGPNETVNDRSLQPGEVVSVINAVYDADGEYQMRPGYTQLGAQDRVRKIATYDNEVILIDGNSLYSSIYPAVVGASNSNTASLTLKDAVPQLGVTHKPLHNASGSFSSWAIGDVGAYRVVAWVDGLDSLPRAAVYMQATDTLVCGPTVLATSGTWDNIQVAVNGTIVAIAAFKTSASGIFAMSVDTSLTSFPQSASLAGGLATQIGATFLSDTSGIYGFCSSVGDASFWLVYWSSDSTASIVRTKLSTSLGTLIAVGTISSGLGASTTFAGLAISANFSDGIVWISGAGNSSAFVMGLLFANGSLITAAHAITLSSNISAVVGLNVAQAIGITRVSATQALTILSLGGIAVSWQQHTTSAVVVNTTGGAIGYRPVSAPTLIGSTVLCVLGSYALVTAAQAALGSYVLADLQLPITNASPITPTIVSVLSPQQVNWITTGASKSLPLFTPVGSDYEVVLPNVRDIGGRQGLELYHLYSNAPWQWSPAKLGRELYLSSHYYDRSRVSEIGFAETPVIFSTTVNAGGGGSFQYVATYARIDAQGNLEESAPSIVQPVLGSTSSPNVNVTIYSLHATSKQRTTDLTTTQGASSPVYILIYRTPNLANGDTTFYRVTSEPWPSANRNSLAAATVSIIDTTTDASLTDGTHPILYTVGGELPHNAPESMTHSISHKDRIWGIGADQRTVWLSQTYSDSVLPAWNIILTFTIDDATGPLTALASLYDKLLIFTRDKVYVVYGDGPSDAGTNSDLTPPQWIPSAAGCIDPRSVVTTPLGVMYQSTRGIEMIDMGLGLTFIGLPVSVTTATYPVCTSALLCADSSTIRFTFVTNENYPPDSTTSGRVVVYDLRRNRWTILSLQNSDGVDAPVESAAYQTNIGYLPAWNLKSNGAAQIFREKSASDINPWLDDAGPPTMTVTTAWIRPGTSATGGITGAGGQQGWSKIRRIYLLAKYYDKHSLSVTFNYNYSIPGETQIFNSATLANVVSGNLDKSA